MLNSEMTTAFGTAVDGVQGDVVGFIVIALPVALGIAGLFIAIKLGIKFFKSTAK